MNRLFTLMTVTIAFCSCLALFGPMTGQAADGDQRATLINTYSLLYDLLGQEQHVSKLLVIKLESDALDKLVGRIADTSEQAVKQLDEFATNDPSLKFDQINLPPGELAVRQAIAETKRGTLLKPFNDEFEFHMLLTQSEALSYGRHLADVAAGIDMNQERVRFLQKLSQDLQRLQQDVLQLLRENIRTKAE